MIDRIRKAKPYQLFLEEWIEAKGLTQEQVAERMECSPGTVSKLVQNKMKRTPEWLAAIAFALDIEVVDLYRHPQRPTQQDLLRNLPESEQARIIAAIRALTGTDG